MPFVPQELIDIIVQQVDGTDSLKACALTGRMFRHPSQRILLQSITLWSWTVSGNTTHPNFYDARWPLLESPHIRPYIKYFTIRLCLPLASLGALKRVLDLLTHVRRFTLDGDEYSVRWSDIRTTNLSQTFVDFFSKQPLQHLQLRNIDGLPPNVFARAAPLLSFGNVSLSDEMPSLEPEVPITEGLILQDKSTNISAFFAKMAVRKPHLGLLRRLSMNPRDPSALALLMASAHTIQHLHLNYRESMRVLQSQYI
ncbi:hypothetical protein DFH06DRAFT_1195132 [Mycena polygramma]|nr:hypothetical protein DFH06DRAFT_1195132 [Mycena polygramma]